MERSNWKYPQKPKAVGRQRVIVYISKDIKKDIKNVITSLSDSLDKELYSKSKDQLEEYWHFKYDKTISPQENIYYFYDMLKLYGSFCRQWEEKHNGSCCVVGRVKGQYLMPKIELFYNELFKEDNNG